jgi:hypothetical protein
LATHLSNDQQFAVAVKEFFRDAAFRTTSTPNLNQTTQPLTQRGHEGKAAIELAAQRQQLETLFARFRGIVDVHVARFLSANQIAEDELTESLSRLSAEKLFSVDVHKPPSRKHAEYVCGLLEKVCIYVSMNL